MICFLLDAAGAEEMEGKVQHLFVLFQQHCTFQSQK